MTPNKTNLYILAAVSTIIIAATFIIPCALLYNTVVASTWTSALIYGCLFLISMVVLGPVRLIRSGRFSRYCNDIIRLITTL